MIDPIIELIGRIGVDPIPSILTIHADKSLYTNKFLYSREINGVEYRIQLMKNSSLVHILEWIPEPGTSAYYREVFLSEVFAGPVPVIRNTLDDEAFVSLWKPIWENAE